MSSAKVKSFYRQRLGEINRQKQLNLKRISLFSWLRLISFGLFIFTIYLFSAGFGWIWMVVSTLSFVSLIALIIYHQKLYHKSEHLQAVFDINENEIKHLEYQPSLFDNGNSYTSQLPFADDLDLFGDYSIFHYLNRSQTTYGKDLLAQALLQAAPGKEQIEFMQEAVKEFSGLKSFCQDVMTALMLTGRKKEEKTIKLDWSSTIYLFESKFFKAATIVMPAVVLISLVVGIVSGSYLLFMLNGAIAMMLTFGQSKKMMLLSEEIGGRTQAMKAYAGIFSDFGSMPLKARLLKEMADTSRQASVQFRRLALLSERFDRRNNLLLYVLANIFLMYDFRLALSYEAWKRRNLEQVNLWLETLGRIELFISLGTYTFNHPECVFPVVTHEKLIRAAKLGHPLIRSDQLVENDIELAVDPRIMLVTGSNMSGKSTFLRTLGVNVILAQAGAPVHADSFEWKPLQVLSSLRQSDSLQENTSLFLHELKQLRYILDHVAQGKYCLVLLDEVLRGTNSEDKYHGTYNLIMKLLRMESLVVMATHDLKLSMLEKSHPAYVVNYCFESHIKDGQLLFDYTVRKGVAVNRNATWLMKDMGIID